MEYVVFFSSWCCSWYRVVADSFRKKFPNIDTLEVFISPFKTDYRTVVKGK